MTIYTVIIIQFNKNNYCDKGSYKTFPKTLYSTLQYHLLNIDLSRNLVIVERSTPSPNIENIVHCHCSACI